MALEARLQALPHCALLEIAAHGCRADERTMRLADLRLGEAVPLADRFVSGVLLAPDLMHEVLSRLDTSSSGAAACVCR